MAFSWSALAQIGGLLFVVLFVIVMLIRRAFGSPEPGRDLRPIRAFSRLRRAVLLTVESGRRLHVSLGRGEITGERSAIAFSGLSALQPLAEATSLSDKPTIVTSGTGPLGILSRSTLYSGYRRARSTGRYRPTQGRVSGLTPFSYAVGALLDADREQVSTNFLIGSFGAEIGLLAEPSRTAGALTVAGTDNIPGQAVAYAAADEPLIGEEAYASGAYAGAGGLHGASLFTQDLFRWLIIAIIIGGAIAKLIGS